MTLWWRKNQTTCPHFPKTILTRTIKYKNLIHYANALDNRHQKTASDEDVTGFSQTFLLISGRTSPPVEVQMMENKLKKIKTPATLADYQITLFTRNETPMKALFIFGKLHDRLRANIIRIINRICLGTISCISNAHVSKELTCDASWFGYWFHYVQ